MSTDPAGHVFVFLLPAGKAAAPVAGVGASVAATGADGGSVGESVGSAAVGRAVSVDEGCLQMGVESDSADPTACLLKYTFDPMGLPSAPT